MGAEEGGRAVVVAQRESLVAWKVKKGREREEKENRTLVLLLLVVVINHFLLPSKCPHTHTQHFFLQKKTTCPSLPLLGKVEVGCRSGLEPHNLPGNGTGGRERAIADAAGKTDKNMDKNGRRSKTSGET